MQWPLPGVLDLERMQRWRASRREEVEGHHLRLVGAVGEHPLAVEAHLTEAGVHIPKATCLVLGKVCNITSRLHCMHCMRHIEPALAEVRIVDAIS